MHPTKKAARIAGAVYRLSIEAVYFWIYLPGKLIARGNAGATVANNRHPLKFSEPIVAG
jgi:hypothetical protein